MNQPIGPTSDTILYLSGVNKTFDGFRAINNLSITLDRGEMRAVIGPNGAGKSTMMDIITGKTRPDAGRVVFGASTDLTRMDEPAIASLGIGRKFQKPTVFESHTVWDNLLLALAGDRRARFTLRARRTAAETEKVEALLLDAAHFPTIHLQSEQVRSDADGLHMRIRIVVRDHSAQLDVPLSLERSPEQLSASGDFDLTHTELGLSPYSVALGALRVADRMHVRYRLVALPDGG